MHWIYHLGIVVLSAPRQCMRCLITGDCWMRRYGVSTFLILLQKEYFPFSIHLFCSIIIIIIVLKNAKKECNSRMRFLFIYFVELSIYL